MLAEPLPEHGEDADAVLARLAADVLPYPFGNGHPRFAGWVNGPPVPLAVLAEALAAAMNPSVAGGNHAATYVEHQVLHWLKDLVGFPVEGMGLLVSGGSAATFHALAVARHRATDGRVRAERPAPGRAEAHRLHLDGGPLRHRQGGRGARPRRREPAPAAGRRRPPPPRRRAAPRARPGPRRGPRAHGGGGERGHGEHRGDRPARRRGRPLRARARVAARRRRLRRARRARPRPPRGARAAGAGGLRRARPAQVARRPGRCGRRARPRRRR